MIAARAVVVGIGVVFVGLLACAESAPAVVHASANAPSSSGDGAPRGGAVSAAPATSAPVVTRPRLPRLSAHYPGARRVHWWVGGHAHSVVLATVDPVHRVKTYYREYARQNPGYELEDGPAGLVLDGGAAMGVITVRAIPSERKGSRFRADERTVIDSSRP